MDLAISTVLVLAAVGVGLWLGVKVASRMGVTTDWRDRKGSLALLVAFSLVAGAAGSLIETGHVGVGLAILVAIFVLPEFVIVPLRVRRSRQRAEESRARRASGDPGPGA